ncbi:MAG: 4a-hydroxytetrahydrobiopterin dehydratase [Anaerolineae bacterium]|jgi:4a-hydroxytetrahydrobiopterin dehydratase|nr:4a-hydroxytetrahydrobiopterin dehydratase [Anaerolineae bacterium]
MSTPPLSDSDITAALADLPGWARDGDTLTKTYALPSYLAGVAFASAVGVLSEGLDHHPDLHIGWRKVTVRYNTHDAGSKITAKDVQAARAVEALGYPK